MKQTNSMNFRKLLRFIPAIVWMIVIYLLSSQTGDDIGTLLPLFQKLFPSMVSFDWGHYLSYFILAVTIDYGIGRKADRFLFKAVIVALCGIYGVTDEYHQSFVGGRMPDPIDVRNDMIGALVWVLLVSIPPLRRVWRKFSS
ncbi:MAG: VanZ family protein [Candidatus Pristimantibacillus sp.]